MKPRRINAAGQEVTVPPSSTHLYNGRGGRSGVAQPTAAMPWGSPELAKARMDTYGRPMFGFRRRGMDYNDMKYKPRPGRKQPYPAGNGLSSAGYDDAGAEDGRDAAAWEREMHRSVRGWHEINGHAHNANK